MKTTIRISISVPLALKARMDNVDQEVNWSAVATRAFDAKLGEIASQRVLKTMSDVIDRLRASKAEHEDEDIQIGRDAGREWAEHLAEYKELKILAEISREHDGDGIELHFGDTPSHQGPGERFFFAIHPDENSSRAEVRDFWESALGDEAKGAESAPFVVGFAKGAVEVFEEVKDQL